MVQRLMKKTERLFNIIDRLRSARRPITADQIAHEMGVSPRTIYRDVKLLMAQGLPIIGEAGIGYVIDSDFNAPALQFNADELDVISIGLRLAYRDGDEPMRAAADTALSKIRAGLKFGSKLDSIDLYAPDWAPKPHSGLLSQARHAIRDKNVLEIKYKSLKEDLTTREIKPLALLFFRQVTLLSAYCETRKDFRNFRMDRIEAVTLTGERFTPEHYKLRKAYFDMVNRERETYGAGGL